MRLVTSDIDLFWAAYDRGHGADRATRTRVFDEEYLQIGSVGLRDFIPHRIGSAENLAATVEHRAKYYHSIRSITLQVPALSREITQACLRLGECYADAAFPPVYIVIGSMNSAGTETPNGLIIGAEMFGRTEDTPWDELGDWEKEALKPIEHLPHVVLHELVHAQQKYASEPSLLAKAITEGAANFLVELLLGNEDTTSGEYGLAHEDQLWQEFQQEMGGQDISNWLYQGDGAVGRPADLGYFIGSRICWAYYHRATDKGQAVREILTIGNFTEFLAKSGYQSRR